MFYKLVACDFDDTLYSNSTQSISDTDIEAINECQKQGIIFVLATGRTLQSIRPHYEKLKLNTPIITSGGAEIYDCNYNRIYSSFLEYEDIMALLIRAKNLDVHAHIYKNDCFCYEKHSEAADYYGEHTGTKGIEIPELLKKPIDFFETPKLLMVAEPNIINDVQKKFSLEYPHLNVVKSLNRFVEFYNKSTSKGNALIFLANSLGIDLEETVAVGDTQIDISMLDAAGLSAAPANSMNDVFQHADIILKDCNNSCISQLLYEHVLNK